MSDILFQYYAVNPTTWFYLSSLLAIALFFKFNRVWSIRTVDLFGLILLAPGLLAVEYGNFKASESTLELGFLWLFAVSGLFLLRMLFDSTMVRRPMLEPNLSTGGLVFLGIQAVAWVELVEQNLLITDNLYAWTFYVLTGLHAAHVVGGLPPMLVTCWRAMHARYGPENHRGIAYTAMYWHFLDGVWLVLYATLWIGSLR